MHLILHQFLLLFLISPIFFPNVTLPQSAIHQVTLATDWASKVDTFGTKSCTDSSKI